VPIHPATGQAVVPPVTAPEAPLGSFDNTFSLSDIGVHDTIVLRGTDASNTVHFSLPQTQIVKTATMKLRYHFSPGLLPALSHLKVSLNGTLFATLAVAQPPPVPTAPTVADNKGDEHSTLLEATLTLPAEMLVHDNVLTFEFVGHYALKCEDPAYSALWSEIDTGSSIELAGSVLPLHNDLKMLPLPFYDVAVNLRPSIPIVFLTQPSTKALQAAGIVASWFGILADSRPVRFPVSVGTIPSGNAIIIGENAASLPASLQMTASSGPSIAMRTNPSDPYSKVLVLTGDTADDLLTAAIALTLQRDLLQGEQVRIPSLKLPAAREPDDAPRWLSTQRINRIGDIAQSADLQTDGSNPIAIYMRLPPDLYYGARQNLGLHLGYRYNAIPLSSDSALQRVHRLYTSAAHRQVFGTARYHRAGSGLRHAPLLQLAADALPLSGGEEGRVSGRAT
jgi:cellulose synthase (UDP-forming)